MALMKASGREAYHGELGIRQPKAEVNHHCVKNRRIAEIAAVIRRQQRNPGTGLLGFLTSFVKRIHCVLPFTHCRAAYPIAW
jgi:hypothetical protein